MGPLAGYKKLLVFVIASGVVLAAGPLGIPAGVVAKLVALASTYMIGQGIADHGKFRPRPISLYGTNSINNPPTTPVHPDGADKEQP